MDAPAPGNYWKTPFIWEPGCPEPPAENALRFVEASDAWPSEAIGQVMAASMDASDMHAVSHLGTSQAVAELLKVLPEYFERPNGWWRVGIDTQGHQVGFVLPVLFKDSSRSRNGKPQGTIFYMGVLPSFRGRGYGLALVNEATRVFSQADCWRIFCDTGTDNLPMVMAFRAASYQERTPWQRPVA
jgi:ribosomal protein S18 acetylase RimI-like enzyme